MNVLCIGAGYVGSSVMAIMAQKCPGLQFTLYDSDQKRVDAWNAGEVPVYEPDVNIILAECKGRNLTFIGDDKFAEVRLRVAVCAPNPRRRGCFFERFCNTKRNSTVAFPA